MGKGGALGATSEQTVAARRALRCQYRQLHEQTIAGKENLVAGGDDLQAQFRKLESLHSKVERPREHAVDAEVFAQLTECSLNLIKRGQAANQGRTPADLVRVLRFLFVNDPMETGNPDCESFDWAALGAETSVLFRTAPGVNNMLGPLHAETKVRKAVVRQAKRPVAAVTHPEELEQINESDKQETDRNMENMWRVLKRLRPNQQLPLTHLVCNPHSFSQTVENIFTLSFLVRDQRVQLLPNPDTGMVIQVVTEQVKHASMQQGLKPQQFMMSFTMQDWQIMKQLVPAEACMMPHRGQLSATPPAAAAAAGAGRGEKRPRRVC